MYEKTIDNGWVRQPLGLTLPEDCNNYTFFNVHYFKLEFILVFVKGGLKTMKKKLLIISIILTCFIVLSTFASASEILPNGTHTSYINSASTFSVPYITLNANPTIEYRYKNLKCSSSSATLNVTLYGYKVHWYNLLFPSQFTIGSSNASGLNATNSSTWYGRRYENTGCSSSMEIMNQCNMNSIDPAYGAMFKYNINNTNGNAIHNNYGEWLVIGTY